MKNPIPLLRAVACAEAISFLVLLGIAMPLKYGWYGWKHPLPVPIVGSIHGALFLWFCWALIRTAQNSEWPRRRVVQVFVSGLLPFAPLLLDPRMKQWSAEWREPPPDG